MDTSLTVCPQQTRTLVQLLFLVAAGAQTQSFCGIFGVAVYKPEVVTMVTF